MWTIRDTKRAMKRLNKHIRHLVRQRLKKGHELVMARDGKLIKIRKDGTIEVLKDLPPRRKVPINTSIIIKKGTE